MLRKKICAKRLLFIFFILALSILSIVTLYYHVLLLTLILLAYSAISLMIWKEKDDIYLFITGALIGTTVEIICISAGAWMYSVPTFLGIPLWLPAAWGLASMMIKRLVTELTQKRRSKGVE